MFSVIFVNVLVGLNKEQIVPVVLSINRAIVKLIKKKRKQRR
jgi:hypothetical protein